MSQNTKASKFASSVPYAKKIAATTFLAGAIAAGNSMLSGCSKSDTTSQDTTQQPTDSADEKLVVSKFIGKLKQFGSDYEYLHHKNSQNQDNNLGIVVVEKQPDGSERHREIGVDELMKEIDQKNVGVVFGFSGCGALCPPISASLYALDNLFARKKSLDSWVTLHVEAFPEDDGGYQYGKETYIKNTGVNELMAATSAKDTSRLVKKRIIIYAGSQDNVHSLEDMLNVAYGNAHSTNISFFGPSGNFLGNVDAVNQTGQFSDKANEVCEWAKKNIAVLKDSPNQSRVGGQ